MDIEFLFTETELEELKAVVNNKCMRKLAVELGAEAEALDSLTSVDLHTQEGLSAAKEKSGRVRGILYVLNIFEEIGDRENDSESE